MALLERLAILISADASGALSEMKKVADGAEKDLGKAGAAGSTLSGQMTKVGAAMVGVGVGMLAVGINAANTTENLGKEVIKLQRYTGATAEEASKLAYAARMSGVDVDSLGTNLGRMAKAMDTAPAKFTQLGVEVRTSDGHLRSMGDVLLDVADKFKAMGPGTETTAKAIELFGRNGASMLPFLLKGKDGITELTNEAEKMGLVLSQDNVQAVKDHVKAQRELNAAIDGVKNQIGQEMLPILTDFTKLITSLPGPVKDIAGPLVVMGGGIALVGGAALIAAGQIQRMKLAYTEMSTTGQMTLKVLGGIGIAVTAAVAVWSVYSNAVTRAKNDAKSAIDELSNAGKLGNVEGLQESIAQMERWRDASQAMVNSAQMQIEFWNKGKYQGRVDATKEEIKALKLLEAQSLALADATGISQDQALQWLDTMKRSGKTFQDTESAVAAYTGKIDLNTMSAQDARVAQDGFAESIKNANDAVRAATDPFFAAIKAQDDLSSSTDEYQKLLDSGTATQKQLDDAYLKQVESAFRLQSALGSLGEEFLRGKTGPEKFQAALEMLRQFGIDPSSEQGQKLVEKISGIGYQAAVTAGYLNDNPLKAKVDSSEIDTAGRKLANLRALFESAGLADNFIFANLFRPGLAQGNAVGGRVGAGDVRYVGELGPELFVPDSAGTIVTAERSRQMMAGGGTTVVINAPVEIHTVTGDPAAIERVVVDALGRAYVRGMTTLQP